MPELTDMINFAIVIVGITVSVLGVIIAIFARNVDRFTRYFFTFAFTVILFYNISDLVSQISLDFLGRDYSVLSKMAIFLESYFSSLLMPLLTIYMLHLCREPINSRLLYIISLLWTVYVILLVITQFTTFIYYVTPGNTYRRGPLYPVLLVPPVLLMLVNMIGLYRRRSLLTARERNLLIAYLFIPAVSMLIQMASYGILFIVLGTSVGTLIMFIYILNNQVDKIIAQANEIREQQLKILSLQIRPHFIYNTLTNIYYLCESDPAKAKQIIGDFTRYLRKNFGSVVKQGLIPFADELEHTEAFLAVVKTRYEDQLSVEYDITHTFFRIPPLTLEPIVENAVKHGLDQDSDPLHIIIRTRCTDRGSEIIVENNGIDFSLEETEDPLVSADDEPHIGIYNVRSRLKTLCNGTIDVTQREGGGAVVTMIIPDSVLNVQRTSDLV